MKQYLRSLMKQFMLATGSKNVSFESKQFIDEFSAWIKKCQKIGEMYICFLDYMGLSFDDDSCCEVGKGEYDSVVKPFETMIITPAIQIKNVNPDRIIEGNMCVYDSVPVLVGCGQSGNQMNIIGNSICTFMTQNPFSQDSISGWEDLHNSLNYNIILGMFGSIYDKDIETKIKQFESLRNKLTCGDYKEDYGTSGDGYFYVIGSNRAKKLKLKLR